LAIYQLRSTDWARNRGVNSLWRLDLSAKGSTPQRMAISEGGASSGRWSPDGRWIYFMSSRSGSPQVWKTDADGAKATQVTKLPLPVQAFRLAPDGKSLVVGLAVYPDCRTLECTVTRNEAPKPRSGKLYDKLFVRHWDEWADGTKNHLFALQLDENGIGAGAAVELTPGFDGDTPSKPFGDEGLRLHGRQRRCDLFGADRWQGRALADQFRSLQGRPLRPGRSGRPDRRQSGGGRRPAISPGRLEAGLVGHETSGF